MHKGLIIITERNRQVHLDCLLMILNKYFAEFDVVVAHQSDTDVWNKGLLYNIAVKEAGVGYDYYILHDADFIPHPSVNYDYTEMPTLLSTECAQFGYTGAYSTFFGGVIGISAEHYIAVNGFSNSFRGWGGEDDDFYRRCVGRGLVPERRPGNRFENFTHPRLEVLGKDRYNADYQHNLKVLEMGPDYSDGFTQVKNITRDRSQEGNVTHLFINTWIERSQ